MKQILAILILATSLLQATGAWMISGRTHPELKWYTLETDHFDVHYHGGIRDIAVKGASIAEQVRPILMEQMGLDTLRRLDIVFTTEDEVLNGFAMPSNHTVIWVDQNDAALWVGDEKWMRTVLAHELQHLVFFNTVKTWLPEPMNSLFAGVPGWIVEGLAEYYTEKWRPFRFDISHKSHVIGNTVHKIRDPHNDGFSKSLYLADRFGDSTIVKILNERNKAGLLDFKKSFKKHTGVKLKQFNEDWRRHMNTFFFGQRAQKERVEDVGKVHKLPLKRMAAFDYFNDSLRVAMVGQLSKGQGDLSLVVATRDTAKENKEWKKRVEKAEKKGEKPKKVKPKWKIKEYEIVNKLLPDIKSFVVHVGVVQKQTDAGESTRFKSVVAVGDANVWFGVGAGKKPQLKNAIDSATQNALLNIIPVKLGCGSWECRCGTNHSIPYRTVGRGGSVKIELIPGPKGLGLVAGETIRNLLALAGIKDVWSKSFGSTSTMPSVANAVYDSIRQLHSMSLQ